MSFKEYYIRRLTADGIADVEQLHTAVYGKKPALGLFKAKYDTAYTGAGFVGYIAYTKSESQPVAHYGVIPCFINYGGQKVLAAQSADTMTHPEHRNKGLFVELANQCYQLCREMGIKLVFGFPNQNSAPGLLNKLGWQTPGNMDRFAIPVNGFPLQKLSAKLPLFKDLYRVYTNRVLKQYPQFNNGITGSMINEGYGGIDRDEAYLQYKTYSRTYCVALGRSVVWLKISNYLCIGDIDVRDTDFESAIAGLKALAKKLGLAQITFQSSPGTQLHGLFSQRYEAIPSFPIIFLDLGSNLPTDRIKFTFADIDIF